MTTARAPVAATSFEELRTPGASLVITLIFTGVALVENTLLPWAPFFFAYIWLTTVLPIGVGGYTQEGFRSIRRGVWIGIVLLPLALLALGVAWFSVVYPKLLTSSGVAPDLVSTPHYDLGAALQEMFRVAAVRWQTTPGKLKFYYLGVILVWAAFGEELFYRGYLYTSLRKSWGVLPGAVISSALFGARHATQLGLVGPDFPWGAALSWALFSFLAGCALCWLYEKTKSLTPAILAHYLLNLIPIASALLTPQG